MATWAYLNGQFLAAEKAQLHYKDLSFQRGYGIFDFFRLAGMTPLFLNDHLDRFYASAEGLHLPVESDREELTAAILELVQRNNLPNTGIRLSLTGGYSEDGFSIARPNLLLSQHSFTPPTADAVQKGIRLLSHPYQRQLPHLKTIDYLMAIWLQPTRLKAGADDILYHHNGFITECPRSNFFLVTAEHKIITPAKGVLHGVTRKKVLALARQEFTVEERPVALHELPTAKEAFITSTSKQLLPVAAIDGILFPQKEVSLYLLQQFQRIHPNGLAH